MKSLLQKQLNSKWQGVPVLEKLIDIETAPHDMQCVVIGTIFRDMTMRGK